LHNTKEESVTEKEAVEIFKGLWVSAMKEGRDNVFHDVVDVQIREYYNFKSAGAARDMIRDDLCYLSLDVEELKAKADVVQGNYGFAGG